MTDLSNILNADMATVGAELRRGFAWWTNELRQLVPARLRAPAAAAGMGAHVSADEGSVALVRGGRAVARPEGRRVSAILAIHPRRVLVRDLELPRLSPRDSRAMVALDLDRLVPLQGDAVWFDLALGEPAPGAALRPARLAVVPRATAAAALDLAASEGIDPAALSVARADGGAEFDFLPAIRAAGRPAPWWANAATWWTVAAILIAANIGFAVYRDVADIRRLRELTATQQDAVTLAQRARGRAVQEERRRAAMAAERTRREPLAVIAAGNAVLPLNAWVQRFQWDGQRMQISGSAPPDFDPVDTLRRSDRFAEPRTEATELAAANTNFPPFDVSAAFVREEAE